MTAFVGRALKGPLNLATSIASFDEYHRVFGGLWQPSTLSYAVEQYFENGGRACIIVRVCNGGRAPTLTLRCGASALTLIGLSPGSREFLRAAVDYDGIAPADSDRFNLRAAGTETIEEQEIFRRVSIDPGTERALPDLLATSRLVHLVGTLPTQRPDRTSGGAPGSVGYVASNPDGDDGDALTNYDVIGDALGGTGLFALRGSERQAMLVIDPPSSWDTPAAAVEAVGRWSLHSDHALMFYPRLLAFDRLRGRYEQFGSAAAGAGLLARADQVCPVWSVTDADEPMLRPGLRPAASVSEVDRLRLAQGGVNLLSAARHSARGCEGLRTLLPEMAAKADLRVLAARRFVSGRPPT